MSDARPARRKLPAALPKLDGAARWILAAFWSASLVIALVVTIGSLPSVYRDVTAPATPMERIGLSIEDPAQWQTLGPPIGSEALRANIRQGDRLIGVDGRRPATSLEEFDRQLAGRDGDAVTIVALSSQGVRYAATLHRNTDRYRQTLAAVGISPTSLRVLWNGLLFNVAAVLLIGCAAILMVRRSRDRLAPWASLMMLWLVPGNGTTGIWFWQQFSDPQLAYYVIGGAAFGMQVVILAAFPEGRFEPRWSLVVAVLGAMGSILSGPMPQWQSNIILVASQFAAIAAILSRYRRMPPGTGRQQIRWALFGFAASMMMLGALLICQFLRGQTNDFGSYAWLLIASTVFNVASIALLMIALTVSLMRYRLYDADATISRSVAFGALTLGLLAVFAAAEKVIELLGEEYLGDRLGTLASAFGAAIAAMMIVPLHHRTTHWAERRFRSGLAHLRAGLPLLVGDLRETATPRALVQSMLARVEGGVRARHGAVVVDGAVLDSRDIDADAVDAWLTRDGLPADDARGLVIDRDDPLFPIRLPLHADGVGLVGWLLLGPRPDGSFYGREERAALRDIADPVARALAIALARACREAEAQARDVVRQDREERLHESVEALRRFVRDRFGVDVTETPSPVTDPGDRAVSPG